MKKNDYSEKLKSPKWQKKRLQIMSRDRFTCKKCGDKESPLHVHHKEYINGNDPWDYDNKMLITLCEDCHSEVEFIKEKHPEISLDQIKIYKSTGWSDGSRIMFISLPDKCMMRIYNCNNEKLAGYNLVMEIPYIIKILKQSYNG